MQAMKMKTILVLFILVVGLLLGAGKNVPALAQSSIKVIVNDTAITSMDIQNRARLLRAANRLSAGAAEKAATEELIDGVLRLKEAERRGIQITDAMVDAAFQEIAGRTKLSPSQFTAALKQSGISASTLKERLRVQMAWARAVRRDLQAAMKAEEEDLLAQMRREETAPSTATAEDYVLERIVFTLPANAGKGEAARRLKEAEALRGRFKGCDSGLTVARGLKEVAVLGLGRRLAAEVTPDLKALLKDTPEGGLTKPQVTPQGIEMIAVCQKITVSGESAATAANFDAEKLSVQGEEISKKLTKELRDKANIVYR